MTASWGDQRTLPFAFTEQRIYMLMAVLKGELAKAYGDEDSGRVFSIDDYKMYLLNRYQDEKYKKSKIAEEIFDKIKQIIS